MSSDLAACEPASSTARLPWWRFELSELMAFVTVLALCLSLWSVKPFLSLFAISVFLPATLRTLAARRLAQSNQIRVSVGRMVVEFAYSLAFVFVGYILYEIIFVALSLPMIFFIAMLGLLIGPLITANLQGAISWVLTVASVLLFLYVQWRFLRYTLRIKPISW